MLSCAVETKEFVALYEAGESRWEGWIPPRKVKMAEAQTT